MENTKQFLEKLIKAVITFNSSEFKLLITNSEVPISSILDSENNNILHELCKLMTKEVKLIEYTQLLCDAIKEKYSNSYTEVIETLLSTQTRLEGYTPLHYAVIGNRKLLVKKLIMIGSDLSAKTLKGQTVMHLAASAGSVYLLTYFYKSLGLNLYDRDNTGETPLHIAAGEGMDNSAILLIVWYDDVNIRDNEGFAPLHMAAYSKSYRIIRHLIISGADIDVQDVSAKRPLDIATSVQAPHDIITLLKKPLCLQRYNPMDATLAPVKSSVTKFVIFSVLCLLRYGMIIVFILPCNFYIDTNQFYNILSLIFLFSSAASFTYVILKDPGYVIKNPDFGLLELYEKYNSEFVCPYCEIRKTKDIKHCQHCNRCVKRFDHHCPWIHNCVGKE